MQKRFVKTVLGSLFVALMVSVVSPLALAQSSSSMSPWMGMFDRPSNPTLGSYLGNVRPQQNMQKAYSAQTSQIQAQQQALQALSQGGTTGGTGSSARNLVGGTAGGSTAPSGGSLDARDVLAPPREVPRVNRNPAGFNQYLHYYPQRSMPRQPAPYFSVTGRRR